MWWIIGVLSVMLGLFISAILVMRYRYGLYLTYKQRIRLLENLLTTISTTHFNMQMLLNELMEILAHLKRDLVSINSDNYADISIRKPAVMDNEARHNRSLLQVMRLYSDVERLAGTNVHLKKQYVGMDICGRINTLHSQHNATVQRVREVQYLINQQKISFIVRSQSVPQSAS